jgi:hypothetical protein
MNTALGGNARRIIVAGNLTGSFNVSAGRTDLQIEGGAYTMGTWSINDNCTRIKFIGGSFTKVLSYYPASDGAMSSHIQFISCTINSYPSSGNAIDLHSRYVRIEGCTVTAQDFSLWGGLSSSAYQMTDWMIFNNSFSSSDTSSPEATVRIVGCDKIVFCVNRCTNIEKHNFRIESRNGFQQRYTYASYCRLVNRGQMHANQPGNNVVDIFIEHFNTHMLSNGRAGTDSVMDLGASALHYFTFSNNNAYTSNYCPYPDYANIVGSQDHWTWASNTCNAYQAPPESGV